MFFKSLALVAACSLLGHQVSAQCLTQSQAQAVANNYAELFTNYSPGLANQVLASSFTDQSDSVNSLINNGTTCPQTLGGLTFTSRQAFETASATQPAIPFQIIETYYNCNKVFVRWVSKQSPQQVQGITFIGAEFNFNPATFFQTPWLISTVEAEFNSLAWTVNLGFYHGDPPAGCPGHH